MNISPIFASLPRYSNQQSVNKNTSFGHLKKADLSVPKFETEMSQMIMNKVSKCLKQIKGSFRIPKIVVEDAMGRKANLSIVKDAENMSKFEVELLNKVDGKPVSNLGASISPRGYVKSVAYVDGSGKYIYERTHSKQPFINKISPNGKLSRYEFSNQRWQCNSVNDLKCMDGALAMQDGGNPLVDLMRGLVDKKTILF